MGTLMSGTLELPQFREHIIATDLRGGYQVVAADLNNDGRDEIIDGYRGKGGSLYL